MPVQSYLDLITSQHKLQPKFMAWLTAALTPVVDTMETAKAMYAAFDLDTAVGVQLDRIGEIIGRSRLLNFQPTDGTPPRLDDKNYRIALKAKIAQNLWDGTVPQIYEIWYSLFNDVDISIVDNQNMTMSVYIEGQLDAVSTELLASGYIIPKPAGVGLEIIDVSETENPVYIGSVVSEAETQTVTINL